MTDPTPVTNPTPDQNATPQAPSEITELEKTDVVMVGIGAAGGIAAHVLTDAGLKVVAIEAGPRWGKEDFIAHYDELQNSYHWAWDSEPKFNKELPTGRRSPDEKAETEMSRTRMSNMVGGSSVHYDTMSWRFHEYDFKKRSSIIEKYGEDKLPQGANVADWAVTYDELEAYYEKVEYVLGVSGKDGVNPFEAPRQKDYPLPPLQRFGAAEYIAEGMEELGYHPFPTPAGIISEEYDGRPACTLCGYCGGNGCWNDSKSSTLVTSIPKAEETGNLEIRTNSRVFRVLTDENGRASGVVYRGEDGRMYRQPAKLVILSAYILENVRLLLLSANDQFPDGLANNSGQVGRHITNHTNVGATGLFPGKTFNRFSGTLGQGTSMDDFNADNFDHTDLEFIGGGTASVNPSQSRPISGSGQIPPSIPQWGIEYATWIQENADSIQSIGVQLDTLPYNNNFLDLDPDAVDEDGIPVIRETYDIGENEKRYWEYVGPKLEEILVHQGATETWVSDVVPGHSSHLVGGARAGDDPDSSVLDKHMLTHEIPNLAVLGGAGFASVAGVNPTETIQAWAWFAAEYYAENFEEITAKEAEMAATPAD